MIYVLDACAIIALLKMEAGFEIVRDLIKAADAGKIEIYMNIVNLLEVYYGFAGVEGVEQATVRVNKIFNSSIKIIDTIARPVFTEAARLKATYKRISLADAVGLATAVNLSATFVSSDHHELERIEQGENITLLWFR